MIAPKTTSATIVRIFCFLFNRPSSRSPKITRETCRAKFMGRAHIYEVRPRKDHRGVDLISDSLPFGRLWYGEPEAIANAIGCAKFYSRSHDAVIRVFDEVGNVIATHEQSGEFKEW